MGQKLDTDVFSLSSGANDKPFLMLNFSSRLMGPTENGMPDSLQHEGQMPLKDRIEASEAYGEKSGAGQSAPSKAETIDNANVKIWTKELSILKISDSKF